MKTIIAALIFQFILYSVTFTQISGWYFQNPSPTNMGLNSVKFLTMNDIIAVGYFGTVIKSTDAGLTWSNPFSKTSFIGLESLIYFNISFINPATGFITGNNSGSYTKVYKTTNSGNYWVPVAAFAGLGESIQFLNESTGWVTSGLFIYRTTNGGSSWDSNSASMPSMVRGIHFTNSLTGYSCMYRRVHKTTDGGLNWNLVDSVNLDFTNLYFLNSNTGFVSGTGSIIRKTTDGGVSWSTKLSNPQTGTLSCMNFINSTTGFSVGGGFSGPPGCIYRSTDTGDSWQLVSFTSKYHINSFNFSGNNIVAVGYGGRIFRSSNYGNNWNESGSFHPPGSSFYTVSFIDANTGWTTTGNTGSGKIYRTVDGGLSWEIIHTGTPYMIDKLQFFNANTGYAIDWRTVYKTTNGGFNWVQMPPLNINSISCDISFYDLNTGYASGRFGSTSTYPRIIRTTDGAQSWDTIKCIYGQCTDVAAIKFLDNNTGWISVSYCTYPMGNDCRIFKTTNGGNNWAEQRYDTGIVYNIMDFKNINTGWVMKGDRILNTFDGGNTWLSQQLPGTVYSFHMVNHSTGWINVWGYGGSLLKTTNSGINWNVQIDLGLTGVMEMSFINELTGWAVGTEGLVIKTTNGGELVPLNIIQSELPKEFLLLQNYPNPFNPLTNLKFLLPVSGITSLKIYDVLGREIQVLVNQHLSRGTYEVQFDGSNLPSGVYFYKLESNSFTETKKMVLVK